MTVIITQNSPPPNRFDFFLDNLPPKPHCANDLSNGLLIRSKSHAISYRYIQHNALNSLATMTFDIDRAISPDEITGHLNLPIPSFFIQDKESGRAHIAYCLSSPIHLNPNSSMTAIRYARAIESAMCAKLEADHRYVGRIMKNPLHSDWRTYVAGRNLYDLGELAEYLDLGIKKQKSELTEYGLGRNCMLFDDTRQWAYLAVDAYKSARNGPGFDAAVLAESEARNRQFELPLPMSEVRATAKSVSRWTWKNYTGISDHINRGRDVLKGALLDTLRDKQVLSAVTTNRQRKENTELAIKYGVERLQNAGKRVSIRSVAEAAKVAKKTVEKYKHLLA